MQALLKLAGVKLVLYNGAALLFAAAIHALVTSPMVWGMCKEVCSQMGPVPIEIQAFLMTLAFAGCCTLLEEVWHSLSPDAWLLKVLMPQPSPQAGLPFDQQDRLCCMCAVSACSGMCFYASMSVLTGLWIAVKFSDQRHGTSGQDNSCQPNAGM